jgi:hypothetical protein
MNKKFNANNAWKTRVDNHNDSASRKTFVDEFGDALADGYLDNLDAGNDF